MKLNVKTARLIKTACEVLTSGTHSVITKRADGATSSADVPYNLEDKTRWNLLKNLSLADGLCKDADKAKDGIRRELSGGASKDLTRAEDPVKFEDLVKRCEVIEEGEKAGPFLRVKLSGLKVSNDNPIPGFCITNLISAGLLTVDVDDAKGDAADVIAD